MANLLSSNSIRKICLVVGLVALFSFLREKSCEPTHFSGVVMCVPYHISIGDKVSHKDEIEALISSVFEHVNLVYNKWNENSELSHINRAKGGIWHPISKDLETLLVFTDEMHKKTGGLFDPTVERVQAAWKKALNEGHLLEEERLADLLNYTGWHRIKIENHCVWKEHDEVMIDLGGIAKGYAIDLMIEALKNAGYQNLLVDWGGDFRALGNHPENRPWIVALQSPHGECVEKIILQNASLAASGDTFQNWTVEGESYCHIFDPRLGKPIKASPSQFASTAIIGDTAALADAFATAMMLFKSETEVEEFVKAEGISEWWVMKREGAPL